ncbi:MAG: FecR domain-containing protein [Steroidobacter sp.]|nr:FecR domain-containing protein [Steroidobacter sp.]
MEDGSQLTLGGASTVLADLSETKRTVQLTSGEALFDVAHDPSRPFVVIAGDARITAIGTAFSVRHTGSRIHVAVASGIVAVTTADGRESRVCRSTDLGDRRLGRRSRTHRHSRRARPQERTTTIHRRAFTGCGCRPESLLGRSHRSRRRRRSVVDHRRGPRTRPPRLARRSRQGPAGRYYVRRRADCDSRPELNSPAKLTTSYQSCHRM